MVGEHGASELESSESDDILGDDLEDGQLVCIAGNGGDGTVDSRDEQPPPRLVSKELTGVNG